MAVTILLPTALQRYASNKESVGVEAQTVGEALKALVEKEPQLGSHLFDAQGNIRSFVNVYLGDEDTRFLKGPDTPVKADDVLTIVPSIAGGA
jgi:molybdopterin converting factor small subunit